jgi:hypothetical protein
MLLEVCLAKNIAHPGIYDVHNCKMPMRQSWIQCFPPPKKKKISTC